MAMPTGVPLPRSRLRLRLLTHDEARAVAEYLLAQRRVLALPVEVAD